MLSHMVEILTPQNHYVPRHKNNRYINSYFVLGKQHNGPFLGIFRGGLDFFDPKIVPRVGVKKSLGPLEISLEMAHYVVCPQKK
jgi:hypothetical protein